MTIRRRFAPTSGLFKPDSLACLPGMRMGKIGDKRAIPYLENALRDEACFEEIPDAASDIILHRTDCPVRDAAMRSLKEFGFKINRRGNLIWIVR